jgi:hypothetical protein
MCEENTMKLDDTRIHIGGVLRCCLSTIGHEFDSGADIKVGAESRCKYCNQLFILQEPKERGEHAFWEQQFGDK